MSDSAPTTPAYWQTACAQLSAMDRVLLSLISEYSGLTLSSRGDVFTTLLRSIVGQQISVKAAASIWRRFCGRLDANLSALDSSAEAEMATVAASRVIEVGSEGLAGCGLSQRKIEYVLSLAEHFASGRIRTERWVDLDDEAIIAELTSVRGIGRWTAEMVLIFTLMRPDVFPCDDLGLQKALSRHYFAGELPPRRALIAWSETYRPWRTVLTWYLWRSLDPLPVSY